MHRRRNTRSSGKQKDLTKSIHLAKVRTQCFFDHSHQNPDPFHQSASSFRSRCIALCLAFKASARPPAKLGVGVLRPLSVVPLTLIAESRGAGGGAGLRPPAAGRFAGGAGGVGLALTTGPWPLDFAAGGGGGAIGRAAGAAGGGGGGASSFRYADGAQP